MPTETDRDTLVYLRACMELAGADDGAPSTLCAVALSLAC